MAFHVYPVTPVREVCTDYRIWINGSEVQTNTARVSRFPYNRRWPGHQRSMDQSTPAQFLSLEMDSGIEIEILPPRPFEGVTVRPLSLGIQPQITGEGRIRFRLEKPSYLTVEPYGRTDALHIFADPVRDYGVDPTDPDVIYFGKGEHDVGKIELKSGQTLYLDAGAVVYANVYAFEADDIRILGRGILDNSRNREEILFEANEVENYAAVQNARRIHTIQLDFCHRIEVDGITIRDSLVYAMRPVECRDLRIRNVKVIGSWRYNSDGIDMHNCENVEIDGCFIRTFDDCICVKGRESFLEDDGIAQSERRLHSFCGVRVRNCVLWNDWGRALEIGAETRAEEISDVSFEQCCVIHVMHPPLDCQNVDYADIHHVTWRNIQVEYDDCIPQGKLQPRDDVTYEEMELDPAYNPPVICSEVKFHKEYSGGGARRGINRDLLFENIDLISNKPPLFRFRGYDETYTSKDIRICNFRWNGKRITAFAAENLDADAFCKNITIE